MLDCRARCPKCFSLKLNQNHHACDKCVTKKSLFTAVGATFDYQGPALSLTKKLKYGDMPYLAEALAGFMAAQFMELNWPLPDIIVPVPQSFSHWLRRGYNQSELLSSHLSIILGVPILNILKKSSEDYSQAGLNHEQRLNWSKTAITLKRQELFQDKIILLVDDVFTTGITLEKCAEAILEDCPSSIYALTACHGN